MSFESFSNEFQKIKDLAIETSINAIAIGDLEGNLVYINLAFLKMWEFSDKTEVLGKHILEFWHNPSDVDKVIRALQTKSFWLGELVVKKKDGTLIDVQLSANMVFDDEGVPINMMTSFIDITERKKAEKELRLKNQAIETSVTAISTADFEGKVTYVNPAFVKMWGYSSEEEILGKSFGDFSSDDTKTEEIMKKLKTESKWIGELDATKVDGTPFNVDFSANIIFDEEGVPIGTMVAFLDITERKKVEEELRESEHSLGERVKEITLLYAISDLLTKTDLSYDDIFYSIITLIPPAWQYPAKTMVRIVYEGNEYTSRDFEITTWKQSAEIIIDGEKLGELEVYYRDEKPEEDEGPFLKEERDLINSISQEIAKFIIRIKFEEELKLQSELLNSTIDSIMVINLQGEFIYINETAHKERDYTKEEMLSMKIHDIVSPKYLDMIDSRLHEMFREGAAIFETEHICKDGSILEIEFHSRVIEIEGEKFLLSVGRDISERKKREEELRESEQKFRLIFDSVNDGMLIYSFDDKKFKEVNKTICDRLGYEKEELLQKSPIDVDSEEYRDFVLKEFSRLEPGEGSTLETVHLSKDGKLIPTELSYKRVIIQNEPSMLIIARDITERKKAEEDLRESEHTLNERVKEITSLYAISKIITESEKTYEETFNKIVRVIPPAWQYPEITMARIAYRGKEYSTSDFEESHWKLSTEIIINEEKQGELEVCYSEEKSEADEGPFLNEERDLINAIANEIARFIVRKKYEEELIIMNHALETSPIGLSIANPRGVVTYVNPAFMKLLCFSEKEELLGKHHSELTQMLGQTPSEQELLEARKKMEKGGFWKGEIESIALNGTPKWINMVTSYISDEEGNIKGNLTSFEEITEKKKAEKALEESEELLRSVIDNSPFGYSLEDKDGKILRTNPALIKMLGYSNEELSDIKLDDITPEEHRVKTRELTHKIVNREISVVDFEKEYIRKDGTLIPVKLDIWQVYTTDDKPMYLIGFVEDITNRRKNEREKEEAYRKIDELNEQLKVINTILEHDIRNNLVITNGSIDAFLDSNKESFLHMAKKATTKSENLIDKMKEVVEIITKGERELEKVDVRNITEDVISTYSGIGIQFDLKGKGSAQADATLGSVIDNIIGNALKHSETDTISITIKSSKESCVIEIADNGKGIPDDFKKKLFEHGFSFGSTAGTGLGLYIVKKTIDQYGGSIRVKDNLPKGTIFEIELKKA